MRDTTAHIRHKPDYDALFATASEQAGYFLAGQALTVGFDRRLLHHLTGSGRFLHVAYGLYRFRAYPSSPHEDVMAAWLAAGKDAVTVSHESALDLLDLCDVIPRAIHLTVSRSHHNARALTGVRLHTTTRPFLSGDRIVHEGMAITSATRTILDAAQAGTAPDQIELAIQQAVAWGLALPEELMRRAAERGSRVAELVAQALAGVVP